MIFPAQPVEFRPQQDSAKAPMKTIASIQHLRALACMAVVVFHATEDLGGPLDIGQTGVDLFFVISGFIMWTLAATRESTPKVFLWRRIARIVPLYWLVTLAIFVKCATAPGAATPFTTANLIDSLLFIPYRSDDGNILPVLYPGWTINYEMFFYMLMTAALFLRSAWRLPVLAATLVGLAVSGAVFHPASAIGQTYTSAITLEFLFGVVVARLWLAGRRISPRIGAALCGLGLAILGIGYATLPLPHYQAWRFLEAGVPALLIVLGALACEAVLPRMRLLKSIGDGSYAIYLVHASVLNLTSHLHFSRPVVVLLAVGFSVAVGMALHTVETAVRRRLTSRRSAPKPSLGFAAGLLPAAAARSR